MKKTLPRLALALALSAAALIPAAAYAAPTTVTAQKIIRSGTAPTAAVFTGSGVGLLDVTNGNKVYLATDGVFLRLNNPAAAADVTVTVTDQYTSNVTGVTTNLSVLVARGTTAYLGPFKKSRWADGSGFMQISASGVTYTAMEVMRLPIGEQDAQTK